MPTGCGENIRRRNRITGSLLCGVLLLFLAACGQAPVKEKADPSVANTFRIDVDSPFTSFDPSSSKMSGSNWCYPLVYSYLFVPKSDGTLEPDLATSWTYDAATRTWTFQIRGNARFHDGKLVTVQDVADSMRWGIKNRKPTLNSLIRDIHTDGSCLEISLNREAPGFLKSIADFEIVPTDQGGGRGALVGSGAFRAVEMTESRVTLEANPDYYGGRPAIDRIVFYCEPDKEKTWLRLIQGKTDVAYELTPKNYELIRQYPGQFEFNEFPMMRYTCLLFNTFDPLFSDAAVRKALSHALDRGYMINSILGGHGKIARSPLGVGSPYTNPELRPISYDPAFALRLLEQAGWERGKDGYLEKDGRHFEFSMSFTQGSQIGEKVARYIQLALNDIGARVFLKTVSDEQLEKAYSKNKEFQAVLTENVGVYNSIEILGYYWTSTESRKADAGALDNPVLNRLMQQIDEAPNPSVQKELAWQFEKAFADLQPAALLFHNMALDAVSRRVRHPSPFNLDSHWLYRLKDASLIQRWPQGAGREPNLN